MNDLLESALAAHGGLDRWDKITSITVSASVTGAFWGVKHQADALKNIRFEVDTTRQRLTMDHRSTGIAARSRAEHMTSYFPRVRAIQETPVTVPDSPMS